MRWATALTAGGATFALGAAALVAESNLRLPGDHRGYEPGQPIAFSHRLHAGEIAMECLYCHGGAATSRHAGIPNAQLCMNCHKVVTAGWDATLAERQLAEKEKRDPRPVVSAELRKLYDALGLGDDLSPDPARTPRPIRWVRVHDLPDYVYFDHRVHVTRGVRCESCHGAVQAMERVRQETSLSMGWCIECHRANEVSGGVVVPPVANPPQDHVSTDCSACHY